MSWQDRRLQAKKDSERAAQLMAAMSPEMAALHTEIGKLRGWVHPESLPLDELERELYVTPFEGNYGIAGCVVTLNGSPPRFVAVTILPEHYPEKGVYVLAPRFFLIGTERPAKWQGLRKAVLGYIESWSTTYLR